MSLTVQGFLLKTATRYILLQNENGPCPLLAAANALLLQGTISLPVSAVRTGVATIDDVCNTLAIVAMDGNPNGNTSSQYHIDELMKFFPTLQYGMDVNPRFVCGPTGMEYTIGVNAFDLMKVDLIHGWLVDENDETTRNAIGMKTYNELTQIMIAGNEAKDKMDILSRKIKKFEHQIQLESVPGAEKIESKLKYEEFAQEISISQNKLKSKECDLIQNIADTKALQTLENKLLMTRQQLVEESNMFTEYMVVKNFLQSSSHQLTSCGLDALHSHLGEGEMCVFFRNNHFATMTKKYGVLYLLVTDLGYKNVHEVVWEKLDDISGNTDFVDQDFVKTKPLVDAGTLSGNMLSPEQLMVPRGRAEEDYQLALALSRNENVTENTERELIAAAKLASLRDSKCAKNGTIADLKKSPLLRKETIASQSISDASDRAVALRLQEQYEIDASLENARRQRNQAQGYKAPLAKKNTPNTRNNNGCLIS